MPKPARDAMDAFTQIVESPTSRRELLWLRAHEKGDLEAVKSLERVDPDVRDRMHRFAESAGVDITIKDPRERASLFSFLWHERYDEIEGQIIAAAGGRH